MVLRARAFGRRSNKGILDFETIKVVGISIDNTPTDMRFPFVDKTLYFPEYMTTPVNPAPPDRVLQFFTQQPYYNVFATDEGYVWSRHYVWTIAPPPNIASQPPAEVFKYFRKFQGETAFTHRGIEWRQCADLASVTYRRTHPDLRKRILDIADRLFDIIERARGQTLKIRGIRTEFKLSPQVKGAVMVPDSDYYIHFIEEKHDHKARKAKVAIAQAAAYPGQPVGNPVLVECVPLGYVRYKGVR